MVHGNYSRVFSLPETIGGRPYNATLSDGHVVLSYMDKNITHRTRYTGRELRISTQDTNHFRVLSNQSGVYMKEIS